MVLSLNTSGQWGHNKLELQKAGVINIMTIKQLVPINTSLGPYPA